MKLHESGMKYEEVWKNLSMRTLSRWKKEIMPKANRNKPKINKEALMEDIRKYPDSYGYERAKRLCVSKSSIAYAMKLLSVTYKNTGKICKNL
ncbi:IS630 family transposase domain protein [Candidatus Cyrtobacter comes]|uniref:IS630 family transposase domain protein n=1 Tax=Candidatus Cyrtobacter comes TaxID=675776 RepID=A0ABU5L9N8_9RICK|nr:IS630 transposase-related protein [Candidatus Cyrtobacter comes]MDZ5762620.1 IS630 family transposase domain protein [Candidatus Cyrtobacter comes]